MKLYYITPKDNPEDIVFWSEDIKIDKKVFSCLAFFEKEEYALLYKKGLEIEEGDLKTEYVIRETGIKFSKELI